MYSASQTICYKMPHPSALEILEHSKYILNRKHPPGNNKKNVWNEDCAKWLCISVTHENRQKLSLMEKEVGLYMLLPARHKAQGTFCHRVVKIHLILLPMANLT